MMTLVRPRWLQVEQLGPVTVVTFATRSILDEEAVEAARQQLNGLVDHLGQNQLILDLRQVDRLTSLMIAGLIGLSKKVRAVDGQLALCGVKPRMREVFEMLGLPRVIPIYNSQQEALQSFNVLQEVGA
jgi:anti-anti-sigma factor